MSKGIVINDPGGLVLSHIMLGKHYAAIGAKLVVVYCASASLNLLAEVPKQNVCFRAAAWIGHHSPAQRSDGTESPLTMKWERGRDWIKRGWWECDP